MICAFGPFKYKGMHNYAVCSIRCFFCKESSVFLPVTPVLDLVCLKKKHRKSNKNNTFFFDKYLQKKKKAANPRLFSIAYKI